MKISKKKVSYCLLTLILILAGCGEDPLVRQLREENPFRTPNTSQPVEIKKPVVTCNALKLVIPESYDISNLDVFKNYPAKKVISSRQNPVLDGNLAQQIEIWETNGFKVAIAPASKWNSTIGEVKRFIAEEIPAPRINLFNGNKDFAEIVLQSRPDNHEISVVSLTGTKTTEVSQGEYVFRFQSTIYNTSQLQSNSVNFFLISAYVVHLFDESISAMAGVKPDEITGFEPLTLSGTINNDQMIVISCDPEAISEKMAATEMLYNRNTRNVSLIMLAPSAKLLSNVSEIMPASQE